MNDNDSGSGLFGGMKFFLISIFSFLVAGCGFFSDEVHLHTKATADAPSLEFADIVINEKTGTGHLKVEYRPGSVWNNIDTDVKITTEDSGMTYLVTSETPVLRFSISNYNSPLLIYVCADCAEVRYVGRLPLLWHRAL